MSTFDERTKISLGFLILIIPAFIFVMGMQADQRVFASQLSKVERDQEEFKQEVRQDLKTILDNTGTIKTDLEVFKAKLNRK